MRMKRILIFLSIFGVLLFGDELYLSADDTNKQSYTITVGVINNFPPLEYYGAGYKHQGVVADFLRSFLRQSNIHVKYVADNIDDLYRSILDKKIDVLSYATKSERNKSLFLFTEPYLELDNAIYIKKESSLVNHIEDVVQGLVGVKYDDYFLFDALKKRYPKMSFRFVNSYEEAFELLKTNKIDSFIGNTITSSYQIDRLNLSNSIDNIYISWLKTPISFAVSKDRPKLRDLLQKRIESMDYNIHNNIINKWVQGENRYEKMPIFLTDEENAWIKTHKDVVVGVSTDWKPFSYFKNGRQQGIVNDYLRLITQKTGLHFVYKRFDYFSDMLKDAKKNKIDIVEAAVASKDRNEYMDFSLQYLDLNNIIAINKSSKKINSIDGLSKKRVGSVAGYIVSRYLKKDVKDVDIIEYNDIKKGLIALSDNKLDAFVIDLPTYDYYTSKYKIANLMVSTSTPYKFPLRFGVIKGEKTLLNIINKSLKNIDDKQVKEIYRRWISVKFAQKVDYVLIWKIIGVFVIFMLFLFIWNKNLSKEIKRRKEVEKELLNAKLEAENATKAKSIFLANMSHEIRTPMNSVLGFADLLDELVSDPVQKGYLRSIKVGGKALLGIINDILDLSKIEAGQLNIVKENVHIYNLFLEIEQLFYDKISQKQVHFSIDIEPDIPKYLILDGVRIRQILLNLVGNAIKFTDHGQITLRVGRVFKDENKSKLDLKFEVEDTGVGIPKDELKSIFGDFVQKKKQSVKKYGGTGLGLSICKRLIQIMDGEISVKSEVGKGSTFSVVIKDVDVSSIKDMDMIDERVDDVEFLPSVVLVVDDIVENKELVKAIFANSAIEVKEAKDGKEAVDIALNEKIDLVLMDLQMPVMDGYEATKIIRERSGTFPIIALTASVMGGDLDKVKEYGFDAYIRKPASKSDIINKLAQYLPYKNREDEEQVTENEVVFKDMQTKEHFAKKFQEEFLKEYEDVKDKGDMELIRALNEKMIKMLDVDDIKVVRDYTNELDVCINGFDLVELYNLLAAYPKLLEKIKNGDIKNV